MNTKAFKLLRAHSANAALLSHSMYKKEESSVRDLLTDLMYYCSWQDIDFNHELKIVRTTQIL